MDKEASHNFMSIKNIKELENIVNSQLANKINKSTIENNELMIEINLENLEDVIQYLKSDIHNKTHKYHLD